MGTKQLIYQNRLLQAFTIIELLVVVTIIGVLAAVIMPRLQDGRDESIETKIETELIVVGKRAAIEESKSLTYDVVCGTGGYAQATSIADQITVIQNFSGEVVTCNSNADTFAVSVPVGGAHYCVDSAGNRNERATALAVGEYSCQ